MKEVYFKGKGEAYLRNLNGSAGLIPLGNASTISISQSIEKQEVKNYKRAGGGIAASHSSVSAVTASLSCYNFNPHNLAIAVAGTYSLVAAATVSAEQHTALSQGSLIALDKLPDVAQTVTVTGSGGTPTFVDGTDYEVRDTGVYIVDGGSISAATAIEISYEAVETYDVEALVATGEEYELVFDGENEGPAGGKKRRLTGYKVKISPSTDLPLITEEYGQLNLTIDFLEDDTKTGTGVSKYLKIQEAA